MRLDDEDAWLAGVEQEEAKLAEEEAATAAQALAAARTSKRARDSTADNEQHEQQVICPL